MHLSLRPQGHSLCPSSHCSPRTPELVGYQGSGQPPPTTDADAVTTAILATWNTTDWEESERESYRNRQGSRERQHAMYAVARMDATLKTAEPSTLKPATTRPRASQHWKSLRVHNLHRGSLSLFPATQAPLLHLCSPPAPIRKRDIEIERAPKIEIPLSKSGPESRGNSGPPPPSTLASTL